MFENEELRNEVIVDNNEEVNFLVVPEEIYNGENLETEKGLNGVLIGAAVAATGIVAYKFGPRVVNKVKSMFRKDTEEVLTEKRDRLLNELAEVNNEINDLVEDDKNEN